MRFWTFSSLVLLMGVASSAGDDTKRTWSFEEDPPGAVPKGFSVAVGDWSVVTTGGGKVLAQSAKSEDPVFNIVLVDSTNVRDVDISVRLRAIAGELDQGGGLVWRAKDARNYYVARYNHLEDNYRVYKVVDRKRSAPLQSADIKHHSGLTLVRVTMTGDHIECYLDGKKYLDVHDSTFAGPGKIGLWSKADARSQFDDLTLIRD